jgi:hypothetical protein
MLSLTANPTFLVEAHTMLVKLVTEEGARLMGLFLEKPYA